MNFDFQSYQENVFISLHTDGITARVQNNRRRNFAFRTRHSDKLWIGGRSEQHLRVLVTFAWIVRLNDNFGSDIVLSRIYEANDHAVDR